jgi:hypothetical protein
MTCVDIFLGCADEFFGAHRCESPRNLCITDRMNKTWQIIKELNTKLENENYRQN